MLLRLLPHDSPVHRLWAGTKLLVVAALAVMLSFRPTWPALGVAAAIVAAGMVAAKVPAGAVPRLPRWIWVLALADALLTLRSATPPLAHVGSVDLSLGGLGDWALLAGLAIVILAAALLVGWTTSFGDVAPALARLTAPLPRPAPARRRVGPRRRARDPLAAAARRRDPHAPRGQPAAASGDA